MRTFRYRNALKRHIERNHQPIMGGRGCDDNLDDDSDHENSSTDGDEDQDSNVDDDQLWDNFTQKNLTKLVATSIARLRASSSIVQATTDIVVNESSNLFHDIVGGLQEKTLKLLSDRGVDEDDAEFQNLMEAFENSKTPFQELRNSYQQDKYFASTQYFIKPLELPIGLGFFPHHSTITGHVEQAPKHVTFQYVPLGQLLKCILESKGFMSAVLQYQCSNDEVLRDFNDGHFCKEHPFFSKHQNIRLLLYVDECEVANPLGSKAGLHEIGLIYCTILNALNIVHHCPIAF